MPHEASHEEVLEGIELDSLTWALRQIDAGLRPVVELRIEQLRLHVGAEVRGES